MPKILVIDDEPGMRQVISKILVPLGYEIIGTDEGARSLQIAKEQNPDVVLLDIRLADMDSPDIIVGLIKIKADIPIIVLSGFGDVEAAVELVKIGAFDYISKPFKVNDFVSLINKALVKSGSKTVTAGAPVNVASGGRRDSGPREAAGATAIPAIGKSKSTVPALILAAVLAAVTTGGFFAWKTFLAIPGDAEFKISCSNPSGMFFENNYVWVSDWSGENIYKYSLGRDLKSVAVYKVQDIAPTGIAFDGKNIWTSSSMEQKINKHRLDPVLSIEASFNSPGPGPAGLCYDGKNLWSVDFQQGKVYRHKAGNPSEIDASFDVPAQNPCGLFVDGGYAYVADAKTDRIYKLSDDTFFLAAILAIPGFDESKMHVASVAYDGKSVWVCAGGVDRLFRYRMGSLKNVKF